MKGHNMKNPAYGSSFTKDFDRVITSEVYPAVLKAYGCLADNKAKDDLLMSATDHLLDALTDFCKECRDTYMSRSANTRC